MNEYIIVKFLKIVKIFKIVKNTRTGSWCDTR
jgi:hypothetical protein